MTNYYAGRRETRVRCGDSMDNSARRSAERRVEAVRRADNFREAADIVRNYSEARRVRRRAGIRRAEADIPMEEDVESWDIDIRGNCRLGLDTRFRAAVAGIADRNHCSRSYSGDSRRTVMII